MVAVEDVLTESLGACIRDWFEPSLKHPFIGLSTLAVSDAVKPIPKRWVDEVEVQIDEGFGGEDGDIIGEPCFGMWRVEDGRARLREALTRLDLKDEDVAHPNLKQMSGRELAVEKRRIKQELKRYDAEFRRVSQRLPTHSEKEPMRPLYVYYRKLKTLIAQAEGQNAHGGPPHVRRTLTGEGVDNEDTPRTGGAGARAVTVEDKVVAVEARIESLQSDKGAVRAKLQSFQEKFVSENNRKIRFHKDILPIEKEYRMYKSLKEEITKAEAQLRQLKAGEI